MIRSMASKRDQHNKNSQLLECIKSNKSMKKKLIDVRRCLEQRADVNSTDVEGCTPLHLAVHRAKIILIKLLLKRGANVNAQDIYGCTPLHDALILKETLAVKLLLENGADVSIRDKMWETPLHIAAKFPHTRAVELLLKKGANANVPNKYGDTPLFHAVRIEDKSTVELLLNYGADVNTHNDYIYTPLHIAARSGAKPIVELLLDKDASINEQVRNSGTPLQMAASSGHTSIAELLLSKGADVNLADQFGDTPLHDAARAGETSTVELLLKVGANVNASNICGDTPLIEAVHLEGASIVKLLLGKNVKVNAQGVDNNTPLHKAVRYSDTCVAELLLNQGADVNAQNVDGDTPLHMAVFSRNISQVVLLLDKNADVDAQNKDRETPLHAALRLENAAIATLLVQRGANVMLKNRTGDTPLTYALLFSFKGNDDIINLLHTAEQKANKNSSLNSNQYTRDINPKITQELISSAGIKKIQQFNYMKTTDNSGVSGQLYETKMVSLIFIRVLNHELIDHDILLGVNIHGIGEMDDICLRYRVRGRERPIVLFLQAKHREDSEKGKLTEQALWSDSGDFNLRKYFKSYLMIKDRFHANNDDPMFEGEFRDVDCYFILYTPAKENITKKKTETKLSNLVQDLINTGRNTEAVQYKNDEFELERLADVAENYYLTEMENVQEQVNDFFSKLWICSRQAKQDEVERLIKNEINKHYNNHNANDFNFHIHSNAIFLKAHHEIQKWWMQKGKTSYLSRSRDFFRQSKLACLENVMQTVYNATDIFKINVDLEFIQQFKRNATSIKNLNYTTTCGKQLRIIDTNLITIDKSFSTKSLKVKLNTKKLANANLLSHFDQSFNISDFFNSNNFNAFSNNCNLLNSEYLKRAGTSGVGGVLFRTKVLNLVYLRVLNHKQIDSEPLLATKIRGISFMNDICLRYLVKDQPKPVLLFAQLRYREDSEKGRLTIEDMWNDAGDTSFRKFINAYQEIKDRFVVGNKDPMFEGDFQNIDCYFCLCTTAKESFNEKKTKRQMNEVVHSIINTRENIECFQYNYNKDDIDRLTKMTVMQRVEEMGTVFLKSIISEENKPDLLADKLIVRYHVILGRDVLQPDQLQPAINKYRIWRFRPEFFNSDCEYLDTLMQTFVKILSPKLSEQIITNCLQPSSTYNLTEKLKELEIKLPVAFGNLDMTFRGRKEKVLKRMKTLADKLIYLMDLNKNTKVIEINDCDVGPGKTIEQGIIDINGGIGSAVGNVLILDKDSNMLKFDLDNQSLPHNAALFLEELKSDRHKLLNEYLSTYRIKINIGSFPKSSFNEDYECDRVEATDFFSKFWFYPDQVKEDEVERILKTEIDKIYNDDLIPYSYNKINCTRDFISLHSLDEMQKWWMQINESPYLSRASELFERAELAEIYNLLQTVINYMYILNIDSIDIKVKRQDKENLKGIARVFEKVVTKLFNLFDPQFCEQIKLDYSQLYKKSERSKLSLRVHPDMEWVALSMMLGYHEDSEYCVVAKAGPKNGSRLAKDGFMLYEVCGAFESKNRICHCLIPRDPEELTHDFYY